VAGARDAGDERAEEQRRDDRPDEDLSERPDDVGQLRVGDADHVPDQQPDDEVEHDLG
jgi:hypothetical protein